MLININIASGTVAVGATTRKVELPKEYSIIETAWYDIEAKIGEITYLDNTQPPKFTIGGVVGVALSLWQAEADMDVIDMWEKIKERRDLANASGVSVRGHGYHTDLGSLNKYAIMYASIAINSLADDFVFHPMWKTISGEFLPMTVSVLKSIINIGMRNVSINFANAEKHKVLMSASKAPSLYDYSSGWVST